MKKTLLTTIIIALLSSCAKDKKLNSINGVAEQESVLADKEWQIISIRTFPALIDVNGDGEKDNEIVSSLQKKEREKTIVFSSTGDVFENYSATELSPSKIANGKWLKSTKGDSLTWHQSDGTVFIAKVNYVSASEIELFYTLNDARIKYVFKQK